MESGPDDNPEVEASIQSFKSIVEGSVQPVLDMIARGRAPITPKGVIAGTAMQTRFGDISFHLWAPGSNMRLVSQGMHGLDRVTHGVMIRQINQFNWTHIRSAVFGVGEDNTLRRETAFGADRIFPFWTRRELDRDEAAALTDFLTSPHLQGDKFAAIMRLTPEEEADLADQEERRNKFDAEIAAERAEADARRRERIREINRRNPH